MFGIPIPPLISNIKLLKKCFDFFPATPKLMLESREKSANVVRKFSIPNKKNYKRIREG
jgi:hypothetical protein